MENTPVESADLGPRPSAGGGATVRLSSARTAILETLRAQAEPTTLAALTAVTGLHVNTVREHLDGLVRHGLVRRRVDAPRGRGRPAWLYEPAGRDVAAAPEYAGLAATLAAVIHRSSKDPTRDAEAAGEEWGRSLARERGAEPAPSAIAARREVVGLLDDLGFAPQADSRTRSVRLTRCPLLEAAHKYPDVVCAVHLGLTKGALAEYGAESEDTELVPFAEPGACRLHLRAR